MLSRNLYKMKKSPLAGQRKKAIILAVVLVSICSIAYGFYYMNNFKKAASSTTTAAVAKVETGDRPLKENTVIYINADGGLSLRATHNASSQRLLLIPNGTKLDSIEELDGWYHVSYNGKDGWIAKQYTTTQAPAADPAKDWQLYTAASGYKIKYQPGWKVQDYSANDSLKSASLVAFSNQDLPATVPTGSEFIAPITVNVSTKTAADIASSFTSIAGVTAEDIAIAGLTGKKYTYTSPSTNTQMVSVVLSSGIKTFIFTDGGGYTDDLLKMLNTFTIG